MIFPTIQVLRIGMNPGLSKWLPYWLTACATFTRPSAKPRLGALAGHPLGACADVGDHQVHHRVGLRFKRAVGDDATDLGLDLRRQIAVFPR